MKLITTILFRSSLFANIQLINQTKYDTSKTNQEYNTYYILYIIYNIKYDNTGK